MEIKEDPEAIKKLNNYKYVNERIKSLREASNENATRNRKFYKQVEIAKMFDLPPQNWNKLESGKYNNGNNPTIEHLIQMSVFWGVSIDYLVTGEHPQLLKIKEEQPGPSADSQLEIKMLNERLLSKDEIIATQKTTIEALRGSIEIMKTRV